MKSTRHFWSLFPRRRPAWLLAGLLCGAGLAPPAGAVPPPAAPSAAPAPRPA